MHKTNINLIAQAFKTLYPNHHDPHTLLFVDFRHYLFNKATDKLMRSTKIQDEKKQQRMINLANNYIEIALCLEDPEFREQIINGLHNQ